MTSSLAALFLLLTTTAVALSALLLGLARAARAAHEPRSPVAPVAAVALGWLAVSAGLAASGVLADWTALPPRWPLVPLVGLSLSVLLTSTVAARLAAHVPAWQPVALQVFRVGVELAFWRLHAEGLAPVQITFEGRNLDMLVGLSAPLVAAGIAAGRLGPRSTIAWNAAGLALLLNAVGTVATSVPGPLHRAWPGEPFTALASFPVIWVPAILVPLAVFLHVVSIRQALGASPPRPLSSFVERGS